MPPLSDLPVSPLQMATQLYHALALRAQLSSRQYFYISGTPQVGPLKWDHVSGWWVGKSKQSRRQAPEDNVTV